MRIPVNIWAVLPGRISDAFICGVVVFVSFSVCCFFSVLEFTWHIP